VPEPSRVASRSFQTRARQTNRGAPPPPSSFELPTDPASFAVSARVIPFLSRCLPRRLAFLIVFDGAQDLPRTLTSRGSSVLRNGSLANPYFSNKLVVDYSDQSFVFPKLWSGWTWYNCENWCVLNDLLPCGSV
jgi:hypothetical protein